MPSENPKRDGFWSRIIPPAAAATTAEAVENFNNLSPTDLLLLLRFVESFPLQVSAILDGHSKDDALLTYGDSTVIELPVIVPADECVAIGRGQHLHFEKRETATGPRRHAAVATIPAQRRIMELNDLKARTSNAFQLLYMAARQYVLDVPRMRAAAEYDISELIPYLIANPGCQRPGPKNQSDYRRGRKAFELLRERLLAEVQRQQERAPEVSPAQPQKTESDGDYWSADSLAQQYGCIASCLSRKKNDKLIRWKPAPAGQKDSLGGRVTVLYHRDDAKRRCTPKKHRGEDPAAHKPTPKKTYRVSK